MKHLLVCLDLSSASERVLDTATELATRLEARLTLLHVALPEPDFLGYGPGPGSVRQHVADDLREAHRELARLAARAKAAGADASPLMIQGTTHEKILQEAQRLGASLVIIGSHGHGALHDLLVGSVAQRVLKDATLPVVVVPVRAAR